ncbi:MULTISPECIES: nitrite reductase [Pseudomonas aeruginosa group]|uniref:nitrite reductase n=1 Tax=Pseudomonas aeruginosa group TaxID=136841 RepID=UPI0005BC9FA9|nr:MULTISPECIES: nitrite reductase [Pseudomonas aeruginosa group]MDK2352014.1 cytochrome D1 domain-containing protein [Pseudomonas paraeruginosa]MEA8483641.1 cytochrome D1 domain-containing protein [Pseudomonas aeruginosa]
MYNARPALAFGVLPMALCAAASLASAAPPDSSPGEAERLFQDNCTTCHGADRGGFIAPALHSAALNSSETALRSMIMFGIPDTLMPPWLGVLEDGQIRALAHFIKTTPRGKPEWTLEDIRNSVEILADESTLPDKPVYDGDVRDLMAVMVRGRHGKAPAARVVFYDGKSNRQVGEIATEYAPHILDYDPVNPRWGYLKTDTSEVYKIDLYSLKAVRKVKAGLSGPSIAVSADGRYLLSGSFAPGIVTLLDARTLEPLSRVELRGTDYDGKPVESASSMVIASPLDNTFAIAVRQTGQVWILDPRQPQAPIVSRIEKVGRFVHDAFLAPDRRHMFLADYVGNAFAVVDLQQRRLVKTLEGGCQPHVGSGAVTPIGGRMLAFGTNIGTCDKKSVVTVWDAKTFEMVKQIPVSGATESPAAHPDAPYVAVDIVDKDRRARHVELIDKNTLSVVRTLEADGHLYFPEYTRDGKYLYVSGGYTGDRLHIYDSHSLEEVASYPLETPAGIFSRARTEWGTVGLPLALEGSVKP